MREILFKAKTTVKENREFNNVWVKGNLLLSNNKYYIHPIGNIVRVESELGKIIVMHEVDPSTICQYTGLKDRNGNLIFENDIALRTSSQGLFTGKIIYDKNGCLCHREFQTDFEALLIGSDRNIEVIGNIIDNPELLESEE